MPADAINRQLRGSFYRGNRLAFALAIIGSLMDSVLCILISWLMQQLIDTAAGMPGALPFRILVRACGGFFFLLSGGEKQRIAIARALLKQSSILLADEATAALDAQTAHEITQDILSLTGITRVVVTHRLEASLLECYDEIFVLKDGRIAETGTFAELVQRGGYFNAMYKLAH